MADSRQQPLLYAILLKQADYPALSLYRIVQTIALRPDYAKL